MFSRTFHPDRLIRTLSGTEPFADYCRARGIALDPFPHAPGTTGDRMRRWTAALAQLPSDAQARVELELATVNEMSGADAVAHLLEAAAGRELPDETVPAGAPTALWFALRHPDLFHEVFLHHQVREVDGWRQGRGPPGVVFDDLDGRAVFLAERVKGFFRLREGTGRFCAVDAHRLRDAACFVVQVADRLRLVDAFTDAGKPTTQKVRPALPVLFAYYPADGTVLLKSHLRSRDRVDELLGHFGQAVLGCSPATPPAVYDLDRLKLPFHPLPDAPDMEAVRVKALHLRYPERAGRHRIRLETSAAGGADAIDCLIRAHLADERVLRQLTVCHAELQVTLRVRGRSKPYLVRLWPDRCNLNQSPLAERLRGCLRLWGLTDA